MLPKDVNSSRRIRGAPNSSVSNFQRRKNCGTQTANSDSIDSCTIISFEGKISKNDQNNYKKAIDFVNKWNKAMNEYLKKTKAGECSEFQENFNLGTLPNYMALFLAFQAMDSRYPDAKKPTKKNSFTQTKYPQERIVADIKCQTQYVKFAEKITEHPNDIENIPKKIQQSQYATYSHNAPKTLQISPRIQNSNHCPPLRHSARFSESNIRQPSSFPVNNEETFHKSKIRSPNSMNLRELPQNSPLRPIQSFSPPSGIARRKRPVTGLLSPNGMIASEINANGTPIIVRDMFERVQNPLGIFVSQGNILKNISRTCSSSSSVILSDKDSGEVIHVGEDKDGVERTSTHYGDDKQCGREGSDHQGMSSGCEEEDSPTKHHPLTLNERDLNSKDRNFISSIGIFTEAGELKLNAKTYLERKGDVRRGPFRAPRLSQLHMTEHYNVKSCDSGSLLSDIVSTRSSELYQ